jgi:hypothetical protein
MFIPTYLYDTFVGNKGMFVFFASVAAGDTDLVGVVVVKISSTQFVEYPFEHGPVAF